jgi:hypothetical protein
MADSSALKAQDFRATLRVLRPPVTSCSPNADSTHTGPALPILVRIKRDYIFEERDGIHVDAGTSRRSARGLPAHPPHHSVLWRFLAICCKPRTAGVRTPCEDTIHIMHHYLASESHMKHKQRRTCDSLCWPTCSAHPKAPSIKHTSRKATFAQASSRKTLRHHHGIHWIIAVYHQPPSIHTHKHTHTHTHTHTETQTHA